MKQFIIIFALVALSFGAPAPEESKRSLPAVEHKDERDESGYKIRYVTVEGTIVEENGRLVPTANGKDKVLATDGEVIYSRPDGKKYITKWSAGIDGVKVEGDHLPVAPAVPVMEPLPLPIVEAVKIVEPSTRVIEPSLPVVEAVKIVEPSPPVVESVKPVEGTIPLFVQAPFISAPSSSNVVVISS